MSSASGCRAPRPTWAGVANDAGLIVVDVSNPATPRWLGGYGSPTCSESITVAGQYAYLAYGDQGLEIFDISQTMPPPLVSHHDAAGKGRGVHVVGPLAYLANGYTGLQILDVSDQAAIRDVGHLPMYRALGVHVAAATPTWPTTSRACGSSTSRRPPRPRRSDTSIPPVRP